MVYMSGSWKTYRCCSAQVPDGHRDGCDCVEAPPSPPPEPIDPDGVLAILRESIVGDEPPGLAADVRDFIAELNERLGLTRGQS